VPETSRQIVRNGIAQFFGGTTYDETTRSYRGSGPLIPDGLTVVRPYGAKRINDQDYVLGQAAGRGMGAYMLVALPQDKEIRRTMPAVIGRKRVTYSTVLAVYHLAEKAYAEDAEADVDQLADAIKDLIHGDPSLGGICYQAGENELGIVTRIRQSRDWNERTATEFEISFDTEVEIIA
jgi:hypothetical protein